ncbi:hypothetical protein ACFX2G_030731 [Malus domestica]
MFASLPCHEAQRLTHRDFPIIQQWYCSFTLVERCSGSCKLHVSQLCQRTLAKLSVVPMSYCCVWEVGADKAGKVGASSISEIGPHGL